MARTIATIQQSIITAVQADATLGPQLTSTSSVAIWRLWTYIVAVCQYVLESLFDAHVAEVSTTIAAMKPHTLPWYVGMAKAFQYGYALAADSDVYDNTALTAAQVAAAQIVNYAAAVEVYQGLRIKVATLSGSMLAPLTTPQLDSFTAYMNLVRDAGVRLQITSTVADRFVASLNIYYDPLVLDNTGKRLDGSYNTPVQDAVTSFLNNLPFNGLFVRNSFIYAIQQVPGVLICEDNGVQATYGALPLTPIPLEYVPDAGYMDCDTTNDLTLTFIPHGPI